MSDKNDASDKINDNNQIGDSTIGSDLKIEVHNDVSSEIQLKLPMNKSKMFWRFVIGVVGLLIGIVLLYIAASKLDLKQTFQQIALADSRYVLWGTIFYFLGYVARIFRWYLLCRNRDIKISIWDATSAILGSFALNCAIPARLGDFWRVSRSSTDRKSPFAPIPLGAMFIERITDLLVVVLAAAIFVIPTFNWLGRSASYWSWLFAGLLAVVALIIAFVFFIGFGQLIGNRTIQEWVMKLGSGAIPRRKDWIPLCLLTLMVWIGEFSLLVFILLSLKIQIPVLAGYGVSAFYSLLTAVPIAQAGIGQADYGALELLKMNVTVNENTIGAALIIIRMVNFGGVIIVGAVASALDAFLISFGFIKTHE